MRRLVTADATFEAVKVGDWYDCGRPETLLEANRVLLRERGGQPDAPRDAVFVGPVDLGDDVTVAASVVGPNVSVDDGATIRDSIVRDSIVGRDAALRSVNIERSIVGDNAAVEGAANRLNVGDNSSVSF
jgi:glucose-1-phosphate thymidylyltransferase